MTSGKRESVAGPTDANAMTDNPFVPGIAKPPPFMGQRPAIDSVLARTVHQLRPLTTIADRTGPDFLYIYGPRGTGKTVLLNALRQTIRSRPEPDILLPLSANAVTTKEGMHRTLFRPTIEITGSTSDATKPLDTAWDRVWSWLKRSRIQHTELMRDIESMQPKEAHITMGLGSVTLTLPERSDRTESESLLRLAGPLLITLDEAHMVEPDALRVLLNAVLEAGERMPIALVLAGTPGLVDSLDQAGASFWDRGIDLPLGCLDTIAATDVVARPLAAVGISCDATAIADLVGMTDGYPYFLQLYGSVAFDAVIQAESKHFGPTECRTANAAAYDTRQRYYARRRWEFMELPDGLKVALDVALTFRSHDGRVDTNQLKRVLDGLGPEQTMARWRFMRHKGYIWDGMAADCWEPGIPSLMDYIIEKA